MKWDIELPGGSQTLHNVTADHFTVEEGGVLTLWLYPPRFTVDTIILAMAAGEWISCTMKPYPNIGPVVPTPDNPFTTDWSVTLDNPVSTKTIRSHRMRVQQGAAVFQYADPGMQHFQNCLAFGPGRWRGATMVPVPALV